MILESVRAKGLLAVGALSLFAGHVTLASADPATGAPVAVADEEEDGGTPEDIEVLRRILVKELARSLGGHQRSTLWPTRIGTDPGWSSAPTSALGSSFLLDTRIGSALPPDTRVGPSPVGHSRGFHIPGQGAFLTLDVELPIVLVELPAEADEEVEPNADDVWEETRRQMRERRSPMLSVYGQSGETDSNLGTQVRAMAARAWTFSPDALAAVEETVRRVVSQHGGRIRGLEPSESVSVALHLSPRSVGSRPTALDERTDLWKTWVGSYSAARVGTQRMIVQGASGDLRSGAGNDAVRVHQY